MILQPLNSRKTKEAKKTLLAGDIVGWIGAVLLVAAYLMISFNILDSENILYQLLNLVGAVMLTFLAIVRRALPSAFTNIVWAIIGVVAIISIIF